MNQRISLCIVMTLVLLPGCGTLTDLVKENFPQGKESKTYRKQVKPYLKVINIYDQFNTVGLFDALWLSDEVRTIYADVNAQMQGKETKEKHVFLRRQLKENNHYISFYVLSTHKNPLSIKPVPWALHLVVDGKKYMPFEVKAVELNSEYKMLFGSLFNKYKTPYEVRFERNDANGMDILKEDNVHHMKLFFSTPSHYSFAEWYINTQGSALHKKPVVKKVKKRKAPMPPAHTKRML